MNYVTVVRGTLKAATQREAQATHDATVEKLSAMTRPLGAVGHRPHLNAQDPKQFMAIDTWNNLENLQKFMRDPQVAAEFGKLFDGMPDVTMWTESGWASF